MPEALAQVENRLLKYFMMVLNGSLIIACLARINPVRDDSETGDIFMMNMRLKLGFKR